MTGLAQTPTRTGAQHRAVPYTAEASWEEVTPGLWSAADGIDVRGAVQEADGFIATGPEGHVLGTFAALSEAQQAVDDTASTPHVRARGRQADARLRTVEWALILALPVTGFLLLTVIAVTSLHP